MSSTTDILERTKDRVSIGSAYKMPEVRKGSKVLVFGDTHFDDIFEGKHKDYQANTMRVLEQFTKIYQAEKPDWVILAGDLIGVERGRSKVTSRRYLTTIVQFLTVLGHNQNRLIVVKGNHDFNVESDYNFLSGIKLIEEPSIGHDTLHLQPDKDDPSNDMFIHLRNYGNENESIISDEDEPAYKEAKQKGVNIVIAHNDFYVKGQEEGYVGDDSIDLTTFAPFHGADIVLSGHIHLPSLRPIQYRCMNSDKESSFLNLGCATRPSAEESYNKVWYATIEYDQDSKSWDYTPKPIQLNDYSREFVNSEELLDHVKKMVNNENEDHTEELTKILDILEDNDTLSLSDSLNQLDHIKVASPAAKKLARNYILKAQKDF